MKILDRLVKVFSEEYQLSYFLYNKSKDYFLPYSVKLNATISGKTYSSWGVANDSDMAFFKAFMELIERTASSHTCGYLFYKSLLSKKCTLPEISNDFGVSLECLYPQNSNGVAIDISRSRCIMSALSELTERHVILSSLILNIPPTKVRYDKLSLFRVPYGLNVQFYYWQLGRFYIVVCAVNRGTGFYFSFGCSPSLVFSLDKAFLEATPMMIYSISDNIEKCENFSIKFNDIGSFSRYWRFSEDQSYFNFLESESESDDKKNLLPVLKDIFFSDHELPSYISIPVKLYCKRAISPQAQQLFFDNWDYKYINNRIFNDIKLPNYPHPIA